MQHREQIIIGVDPHKLSAAAASGTFRLRARDELTSFSGLWRLRLCYGGPGGVVGAALPGAAAASE